MKSYVLGFAFSPDHSKVVLIAKTRPAWQAGRLNGVGGHVEPGETPAAAMEREFREESLCEDILDWEIFGRLRGESLRPDGWEVRLYHAHYQTVPIYCEHEEGVVSIHHTSIVLNAPTSQNHAPLPNLRYLIPMALNHLSRKDAAEFFEIQERAAPADDEEIRAGRGDYATVVREARKILEELDDAAPRGATMERLRTALSGVPDE